MQGGEAFRDSAVQEAVWGVVREAWPGEDALTGQIDVVDAFVCVFVVVVVIGVAVAWLDDATFIEENIDRWNE